ncbi:oxysterol-binding protein-related protein 4B-like isoform X1 [Vicia villosa]|uniref:oxysterol-binding protein-related protein 4B-like isoform X1 n=1 Tax=Vicia villosa TaxID=3911 RepID=UPI00273BF63A|nr:oxysterol-binding protein-related protein 4B-like isoform X1 [Vicia villosa]
MAAEGKKQPIIVLTKPFSLQIESDSEPSYSYRAPNIVRRLLSLFKNVRPGADLTNLQLPPLFYFPKSQLQCYGESVYSTTSNSNLLTQCNNEQSPLERLTSVVAWSISTTRPMSFGVAPYNPILGETHHVSKGNLNVLLEQVSINPPVSALHATDKKEHIEMIWSQQPAPKFRGTSIEAEVLGKRVLKLRNHEETYEMNSPRLSIRILPFPGVSWVGNVNILCKETGLVAELSYKSSYSFLGLGGNSKLVQGKILDSSSLNVLYEIDGQWDRTVKVKDTNSGKVKVIYDAKEVISGLKAPIVKDAEGVLQTESALIWGELTQAIISNDWEKAKEAKKGVEERQKKMLRERETKGESWTPKNFVVSYSNESGLECDCSPINKWVPPAPITAL